MTQSKEYGRKGLWNQINRERIATIRGPISRSRQVENNVDWQALSVTTTELVDPDTGKFFFVPGFSIVGGPDIVRH